MALKGHLQHFGLGELFQTLACNRHTGTLYVSSRTQKKTIYFSTGSIAFLASGSGTIRIGEILQRLGRITDAHVEAATAEQKKNPDKLIGRILIEQGAIDQSDLQTALKTKFEEELYELLMWEEGDFEFVPDYCPPDLLEPMQRYTQVSVDPQSVIIEGLRQLDESRIIRSRIPDPRIWFERTVSALPSGAETKDDEQVIWELCAERGPVVGVQTNAPGTRFHAAKVLYRFLEEGWLRTLSFAEHLELVAELKKSHNRDAVTELYRFLRDWGVAEASEPQFLEEVGRYFLESGEKRDASETLDRAFETYRAAGNLAGAWEVGRVLRAQHSSDLTLLQRLWTIRVAASPRATSELRGELLSALRREGQFHEAEALLAEVEDSEGDKVDYWTVRAELAQRIGQTQAAVHYLEMAGGIAEREKDVSANLRIARQLYEIDPEIPGLRARIEGLTVKVAHASRLRKLRKIILVTAAVLVMAVAIPAVQYEAKARGLFQESLELQTASAETSQLEQARDRLQEIVDDYQMSTIAGRSRSLLSELTSRIRTMQEEERARIDELERQDRLSREGRKGHAESLLASAREAEKEDRAEEARALYDELLDGPIRSLTSEVRSTIRLPLSIESIPSGATVRIDGEERGKTPFLHHFRAEDGAFTVVLTRTGCRDAQVTHVDNGGARLRVTLDRAALSVGALPGGLDHPARLTAGLVLVPCRDGKVYALPDTHEITQYASRVLPGGVPGHPSPHVLVGTSLVVIAAFDGSIFAFHHEDWRTAWRATVDAPIRASLLIGDDRLAIGDEHGHVVLFDLETGQELAHSEPGFPIEHLAFRGDMLVATDRARRVRTLELGNLETVIEQTMSVPITAILSDGTLLLENGKRHGFDGEQDWPRPGTAIVERDGRLYYGTRGLSWVEIEGNECRTFVSPTELVCPPLRVGELVFLGGRDGRLYCATPEGVVKWSLPLDARPVDLVRTTDGQVLVMLASGQLLLVEGTAK